MTGTAKGKRGRPPGAAKPQSIEDEKNALKTRLEAAKAKEAKAKAESKALADALQQIEDRKTLAAGRLIMPYIVNGFDTFDSNTFMRLYNSEIGT